jgi:hypothetical protein
MEAPRRRKRFSVASSSSNAGVDHRVAAHFEGVVFAGAEHVRRHADGVAAGLQRLDRRARGDAAHHRDRDRTAAVVLDVAVAIARWRADLAERAFDDAGGEAAAAGGGGGADSEFRQLDDLDGAGAVRQPADEAALFQRGDQAVDAGLGAQIERILHLVEGGRHAGFLQPLIDESQKFILFAREHLGPSLIDGACRRGRSS